jgi:hypothetical protein
MKSLLKVLALALTASAAITGCGGGGGGYGGNQAQPVGNPGTAPPPAAVGFTSFSKQVLATDEREAPREVDMVTFTFDGDQDPTAYDDVLPPTT